MTALSIRSAHRPNGRRPASDEIHSTVRLVGAQLRGEQLRGAQRGWTLPESNR
jgi:hypothetical protein